MTKKDDGGQAYPLPCTASPMGGVHWAEQGMSLRDYFAAAAMQGMLSCPDFDAGDMELVAKYAYIYANAMIAERNK